MSKFTYAERVARENERIRLAGLGITVGDYSIATPEEPSAGGLSVVTTVEARAKYEFEYVPDIEVLRGLVLFATARVDVLPGVRHVSLLFCSGIIPSN